MKFQNAHVCSLKEAATCLCLGEKQRSAGQGMDADKDLPNPAPMDLVADTEERITRGRVVGKNELTTRREVRAKEAKKIRRKHFLHNQWYMFVNNLQLHGEA
jgi:hypothetical protein